MTQNELDRIGILPCGCYGDIYHSLDASNVHVPGCLVRQGKAIIRCGTAGFDGPCFNSVEIIDEDDEQERKRIKEAALKKLSMKEIRVLGLG